MTHQTPALQFIAATCWLSFLGFLWADVYDDERQYVAVIIIFAVLSVFFISLIYVPASERKNNDRRSY